MSPTFSSRSSRYTFPPLTAGPPKPAPIGTVQSTFGPSCGHVRSRPFCSEVWFRRGPYSHGQSAAKTEVTDNATMIVTSLTVCFIDTTPSAPRWTRPPSLSQFGTCIRRIAYRAASDVSCLFLLRIGPRSRLRVGGFGKRRVRAACTIAVMTTPSRQARLYTRRLRNTQRLQSRPGRRADGFTRSAAAPGEDTLSHARRIGRSDDSPTGSRRTLRTTVCFRFGSRAPMPYASRR